MESSAFRLADSYVAGDRGASAEQRHQGGSRRALVTSPAPSSVADVVGELVSRAGVPPRR